MKILVLKLASPCYYTEDSFRWCVFLLRLESFVQEIIQIYLVTTCHDSVSRYYFFLLWYILLPNMLLISHLTWLFLFHWAHLLLFFPSPTSACTYNVYLIKPQELMMLVIFSMLLSTILQPVWCIKRLTCLSTHSMFSEFWQKMLGQKENDIWLCSLFRSFYERLSQAGYVLYLREQFLSK